MNKKKLCEIEINKEMDFRIFNKLLRYFCESLKLNINSYKLKMAFGSSAIKTF